MMGWICDEREHERLVAAAGTAEARMQEAQRKQLEALARAEAAEKANEANREWLREQIARAEKAEQQRDELIEAVRGEVERLRDDVNDFDIRRREADCSEASRIMLAALASDAEKTADRLYAVLDSIEGEERR